MVTVTPLPTEPAAWGEGPVWWQDQLHYVDIEGHALLRHTPADGAFSCHPLGERVGFALPCSDGRWIWGGDSGIHLLDPADGRTRPVAHPEAHLPRNRFNDAAVSPDGRLFAGTIATDKTPGAAALYRIDPDLTCHRVLEGLTNSNGIDWSPDGATLYHIDTPARRVQTYAYDSATGAITPQSTLVDTDPLVDASPDGLTLDRDGHLWIAFCHGACVLRIHGQTGALLQRVDLPCIETTSCCFGGPGLETLYVTTGIAPGKPEPHAGRLFALTGLPAPGRPQTPFRTS
jgi:sugar lactone lactonase YvrE